MKEREKLKNGKWKTKNYWKFAFFFCHAKPSNSNLGITRPTTDALC